MVSVACHVIPHHGWSQQTVKAMAAGIRAAGDQAVTRGVAEHTQVDCDAAVFWGYIESCQKIMRDYRAAKKPVVYIDLGYWQRAGSNPFFKVAVNARHPTVYFQHRPHDDARSRMFGVTPAPWRSGGRHILLAGMSAKAAWAERLEPVESFERDIVARLRSFTDREIMYRPKPSWSDAKPIPGTYFARHDNLDDLLVNAHAVVTHHSNVAVDGLVAGVPCFAWEGVALPMGRTISELTQIEEPRRREDRQRWLNDVAYTQWSIPEMRDGTVWRHLKDEGLVP